MARRMAKAKTTRVNRAATTTPYDAPVYCRDLDHRPRSWMGMASSRLSPRTIRRHVDDLWALGGEISRDLHYDPSLRKRAPAQLLRNAIHQDGGPLLHNGSEKEQRSFGATRRKLHRFLSQAQP